MNRLKNLYKPRPAKNIYQANQVKVEKVNHVSENDDVIIIVHHHHHYFSRNMVNDKKFKTPVIQV